MTLHCFADGSIGPANHPSPFDAAWRTRIPSSWSSDDQPKRRIGSSDGWLNVVMKREERREEWPGQTAYQGEMRERYGHVDDAHVKAWRQSDQAAARPFRFEDLNGKPEPKSWGPLYPTLPGVEKWRKIDRKRPLTPQETRDYGAAVGAAIRALQRRELCGDTRIEVDLRCTVRNTTKTDNTAAGEEARYQDWLARLAQLRADRANSAIAIPALQPKARKAKRAPLARAEAA
jgi:hypothetical protein